MKPSVAFTAALLFATACGVRAQTPMSYLETFGPAADPVTRLAWGLIAVSLVVCVLIGALLLGGIFRRRGGTSVQPASALAVRRDGGGLSWIYVGVGVS